MTAKEPFNLRKISNFLSSTERSQNLWGINELKKYFQEKKLSGNEFEGNH
jgi:hypothetical protein